MSTAKRLTPNKIANLVMADEAWHDSEYVAASDYDALSAELAALRAEVELWKERAYQLSHAFGRPPFQQRARAQEITDEQ